MTSRGLVVCLLLAGVSILFLARRTPSGAARADTPTTMVGDDLLIADFEADTYGDWTTTGTAFGSGPARGETPPRLQIEDYAGQGVASSEINGDAAEGALTSPPFKIERKYISFLIGGGMFERYTCLNLLVDGRVVRSATGWNSDRLVPVSWEVTPWRGKKAQVELIDTSQAEWGHIEVDQIIQTDHPKRLPEVTEPLYGESLRPLFHFTARQWTWDPLESTCRHASLSIL